MAYRMSVKVLKDFILRSTQAQILMVIEDIHPADLLDAVRDYPKNKLDILNKLPEWAIASIIDEAEDDEKYELLALFESSNKQKDIVEEMSSDELADMLGTLDTSEANDILAKMDKEDAEDVRELLSYAPDTAGGLMASEFLSVKDTMTVKDTLDYLRTSAEDAETSYFIYILDEGNRLKGVVSLRDLLIASSDIYVSEIMNANINTIKDDMDQEEVAHIFRKYSYHIMPVINSAEEMVGIITIDDVIRVIESESTEDIHHLAGLQEDEKVTDTLKESVGSRLPWLFIKLLTALLACAAVARFQGTIEKLVLLAAFIPVVSGIGDNVGNQTLTIIVRGIGSGDLNFQNYKKVLLKEIGVGICSGVIMGSIIAICGFLWTRNVLFGVVVLVSMIVNLIIAACSGFIVPMILKRLRKDPALASTIFVNAITEVFGFIFYLGFATLLIPYLE
ncbi:MAG: magnesium transporter [Bacillota bacterium]|nr:magnesium transporter [Bacillota bacterium]